MCHKEEHIHHQNSEVQWVSVPNLRPASVSENYFDRQAYLKWRKKKIKDLCLFHFRVICRFKKVIAQLAYFLSDKDFTISQILNSILHQS